MNRRISARRNEVLPYVDYLTQLGSDTHESRVITYKEACQLLGKQEDYTPKALATIFRGLQNLSERSTPQDLVPPTIFLLRKAAGYYILINNALAFAGPTRTTDMLAKLFIEHREALVHWLGLILSFESYPMDERVEGIMPDPLYLVPFYAASLMKVIPKRLVVDRAVWYSPAFMHTFLSKLWRLEQHPSLRRLGRYPVLSRDIGDITCMCPIMDMAGEFFYYDSHLEAMRSTLSEDPTLIRSLIEGVLVRATFVHQRCKHGLPLKVALRAIKNLITIISGLFIMCDFSDIIKEYVMSDVKLAKIISSVVDTLICLLTTGYGAELVCARVPTTVDILLSLVTDENWAMDFSRRARLASSVMSVAGLAICRQEAIPVNGGISQFSLLELPKKKGWAVHPAFARSLKEIWSGFSNLTKPEIPKHVLFRWEHLLQTVETTLSHHRTMKEHGLGLCDNLLCKFSKEARVWKKCSHCLQVAYCSIQCQKEDWETLHRNECSPARLECYARKAIGIDYTVKERAVHLRILQEHFHYHVRDCTTCKGSTPSIVTLDTPPEKMDLSLHRPVEEAKHDNFKSTASFLEPRLSAYMDAATSVGSRRMVEMVIPVTLKTKILITAVFEQETPIVYVGPRDDSASYELMPQRLLYGAARFGE